MEMAMDFYLLSRKTHNICYCRPLPFFSTFGVNNLVLILKNCNNKFWFNIVHWHFFSNLEHIIWSLFCIFVYSFQCYSHHNMRQYDTNEAVAKNIKTARTKNILYICMYHVSVSVTEMLRLDTNLDWSFHCFFLLLHSSSLSLPWIQICLVCNLWQHRICIILTRWQQPFSQSAPHDASTIVNFHRTFYFKCRRQC